MTGPIIPEDAVDGKAQGRHAAWDSPPGQLRIKLGFNNRHKETACEEREGCLEKSPASDGG